jgi:DnaK suppressor protein
MMETKHKAELREMIEKKRQAVKKDIAAYRRLAKPVAPDNAIGRLTRMEAINSKGINEAALNKALLSLDQLERALTKIDHHNFGRCRECEERIPLARLLILPETDLCVQCAEALGR